MARTNILKLPRPEPKRLPREVADSLRQAVRDLDTMITCLRTTERNILELIYAYQDYKPLEYELSIVVNGHQMNDIIERAQDVNKILTKTM